MKKFNLFFLILVILISLIGLFSLLRPGFFLTDDGNSMVIRFSAFYEALRSGQFPVRFLSRLNYSFGYPVADFLYPLFMYLGVPIKALGFSFVDTVKIIFGFGFLSGALFSFLWLRKIFDEKSALVGSTIYSFFPYHLYDLYKRGSVGEVLSLGILPFVLWQIERKGLLGGSIGIFLLILSHNTLAVLFTILILLYAGLDIFIQKSRGKLLRYYTTVLLLGLGLSSFFSLPAIFDLQYTIFPKIQISDWSKYFIDFNLIGVSTVVVFLLALTVMLMKKIEPKKRRLTILMFAVGILSIFLASSASAFVWEILPVSFIQFPFRFLSLTIVSSAFLGAVLVSIFKNQQKIIVSAVFLILALLSAKPFLTPSTFQNYPDSFYSTNQDSTTVKNEYMPRWVKDMPSEMAYSKIINLNGEEKINLKDISANKIEFQTFLASERKIRVNTVYFPGWNAYINDKKSNIIYDEGFIDLNLKEGKNMVVVKFEETQFRLIADLISVLSLLALGLISIKRYV